MKSKSPKKILIVDDEDVVRLALRRTLEGFGYEVHSASTGAEALQTLQADTHFDLVISDHLMPRMTGLELLKHVRNLYPDAMRILVTGYADVDMAISAINEGEIYRFVTKPWDNIDLGAVLALAFEQHEERLESKRLVAAARKMGDSFAGLEARHPGIGELHKDASGAIVISEEEVAELLAAGACHACEAADDVTNLNAALLMLN